MGLWGEGEGEGARDGGFLIWDGGLEWRAAALKWIAVGM